jgi:enoyl-CoA hydratase
MNDSLIVQQQIDKVALLTLNRPSRRNALSKDLLTDLDRMLRVIADDSGVSAVVITGAGERAFCAGADINEQREFTPEDAYAHMRFGQAIFDRLEVLPQPTVAAINGFALGGGLELALACDIRVASTQALMGLPEITLANLPGWGGTQRLPRLVGVSVAKQILLTGAPVTAADARQMGLVSALFEPAGLLDGAVRMAQQIAIHPGEALRTIKAVVAVGLSEGRRDGLMAEARGVANLWGTPAQKAAQHAFFSRNK